MIYIYVKHAFVFAKKIKAVGLRRLCLGEIDPQDPERFLISWLAGRDGMGGESW